MEYSPNDFYLKFNIVYNNNGNFIDYILAYASDGFQKMTDIDPDIILGRKFSDIAVDYAEKLCFKEIYLRVIPNIKLKFDTYIKELERFYLINIFYDNSGNEKQMILYFTDITQIKENNNFQNMENSELYTELINNEKQII